MWRRRGKEEENERERWGKEEEKKGREEMGEGRKSSHEVSGKKHGPSFLVFCQKVPDGPAGVGVYS